MCCSVLQCVVVCCSVLQCVAVSCSVCCWLWEFLPGSISMQSFAVCCSALQWVSVCCSVLHFVAVCCSILQCVAACVANSGNFYQVASVVAGLFPIGVLAEVTSMGKCSKIKYMYKRIISIFFLSTSLVYWPLHVLTKKNISVLIIVYLFDFLPYSCIFCVTDPNIDGQVL